MSAKPVTVLKFGSSVLPDEPALAKVVHEIYRWVRRGDRVIAIVSAMGKTTDKLLRQGRAYVDEPHTDALAALLATGEATSVALLGLALDKAGIEARVLDSAAIGLRTKGPALDAEPVDLDVPAIRRALHETSVLVIPGFVGRGEDGSTTLLGRGGSDMTALFIAERVGATRCRLVKDVDGLYEHDPALAGPSLRRYEAISYDDALAIDGRIVQHKATRYAKERGFAFEVGAIAEDIFTEVSAGPSRLVAAARKPEPLRVGMLGLGVVGLGVYRLMAAEPEKFEVVGVAVRDAVKHENEDVPRRLVTNDPWAVARARCDVVIEAIGGRKPAAELLIEALGAGVDVVTANKAVVAWDWAAFQDAIARAGAKGRTPTLRFSAACGGVTPMIETVERLAPSGRIESVEGIINATSNFILDRLAKGHDMAAALDEARAKGLAEAEVGVDLDGTDVAHKLVLLARAAFGAEIAVTDVQREGIGGISPNVVKWHRDNARALRLVGTLRRTPEGVVASVQPMVVNAEHPLANVTAEANRAVVRFNDGAPAIFVSGKGAGRWPTAEAVFADLMDVWRHRRGAKAGQTQAGKALDAATTINRSALA